MSAFSCTRCELHKTKGDKFVLGAGHLQAKIVIVGDSPSKADARTGMPFSSRDETGQKGDTELLMKLLGDAGVDPRSVFYTTLVKCRPNVDKFGNLQPVNDNEVLACHPHLDRELSYIRPTIIIAMGAASVQRLLGAKSVASVQDRVYDSAQAQAFTWSASGEKKVMTRKKVQVEVLLNKPGVFTVLPTYSFALVRRNPTWLEPIRRTFQTAGKLLRGEVLQEASQSVYHYGHTEDQVYKLLGDVWDLTKTEKRMFFDIETSGLNWYKRLAYPHVAKTLSCAFGFKEFEVRAISLRDHARSARVLKLFREIFETSKISKTAQNGKFDQGFLWGELGFRTKNYDFDTMLAAWQLDQGAKVDLGTLSLKYRPELGRYWEASDAYLDDRTGMLACPDDILLKYNALDVDVLATLYRVQAPELVARGMLDCYQQITLPHQAEALEMEHIGTPIDVEGTKDLGRRKLRELDAARAKLHELTGTHPHGLKPKQLAELGIAPEAYKPFNPGSGPQLAKILYEDLKLKVHKWTDDKKTTPSTDEEALEPLRGQAPFLDALLEYRGLKKQLGTTIGWERKKDGSEGIVEKKDSAAFLAVVGEDGRIHTSINIHGTATGRTSSSDPNLQNVPKTAEFRGLIKASPGYKFGDSDYASLELRILAYLSGDKKLIQAFLDGVDLHSFTAAGIFKLTLADFEGVDYYPDPKNHDVFEHFDGLGDKENPKPGTLLAKYPGADKEQIFVRKNRKERKVGKAINFGVVYGKGAASLADELGIEKKEAQGYLDGWFRTYEGADRWIQERYKELEKTGGITYSMGRNRRLPSIFSERKSDQNEAKRQCINTPVQGTGSDCTSLAVIGIGRRLREELGVENARLVLEIHDQVIVEFKPEFADQVKQIVLEEMERPKPFLRQDLGFGLAAEYDVNENLGVGLE